MQIHIISLFANEVEQFAQVGVVGRALKEGHVQLRLWNPRSETQDVHQTVDDRPYGGGPGMVMKVEPLRQIIAKVRKAAPKGAPVVYLSPQGEVFNQDQAKNFTSLPGIILLAGRYEGIDQRVLEHDVDMEISVGDYVLSGGELPALTVMDAVVRLLPNVLGDSESAQQDSFMASQGGLLDHPHYTRPESIDGQVVPSVLLSGDHQKIADWRLQEAKQATQRKRPDIWKKYLKNIESNEK